MCFPCFNLNRSNIILTPLGEKYKKILLILLFIDIVLFIIRIIFCQISSIFNSIIEILLLFFAYFSLNYIYCAFLVFFVGFDFIKILIFLGQRIQNSVMGLSDIYTTSTTYKAVVYLQILYMIFCVVLIYFSFVSYREFNACEKGEINYVPININEDGEENKGYVPFSGKGQMVGE